MPYGTVPPSAPAICTVVEDRSGNMARLVLRIETSRPLAGGYRLSVRKSDPAGSATMDQDGRFDIAAGEAREVGKIAVSVTVAGQLRVDGHIDVDDHRLSCAHVRRDAL